MCEIDLKRNQRGVESKGDKIPPPRKQNQNSFPTSFTQWSMDYCSRSFRKMPHRRATDTEPMDRILL